MASDRRLDPVAWVTLTFAAVCAAMIGWKPLTMDEIIQVLVMRRPGLGEILKNAPWSAGAVPLGYIAQHFSTAVTGYSDWALRLPAAVFGVASVAAVGALALRMGAARPWIPAALFAAFPLTQRYSVEARPYSQAMFLSVASTIVFLALMERQRVWLAALYGFILTATLYTQPLAALVAAGHLIWAAMYRKWNALAYAGIAAGVAGAAFVPWILWAHAGWAQEIASRAWHFDLSFKTPLMLLREFAGAGYWGSTVLVGLCIAGGTKMGRMRSLLLLMIAATVAGGLIVDATFHYFIASRQFLWVLPACAILAAPALEETRGRWLGIALVLICGFYSVKYFANRPEDWPAAVRAVTEETNRGACFQAAPANARAIYAYYAPDLAEPRDGCEKVVAAIPAQTSAEDAAALRRELKDGGYAIKRSSNAGGSAIEVWAKTGTSR